MIEAIIDALVAGLGEEGYEGEKFFQVDGKKYKQTGEEYRDFLIEATNDPSDPWDVMAIFCKVIESLPKWRLDDSPTLSDALQRFDVMATINSSSAVEALDKKALVLCFGQAVFRQRGALLCMGPDVGELRAVTQNLKNQPVWEEGQHAVVSAILARQWNEGNVRRKLHQLLESLPR